MDVFGHYIALSLFCAVQAVELRAKQTSGSFDARTVLSPATHDLYAAARTAAAGAPDPGQPVHWDDFDGFIQPKIEGVIAALAPDGPIIQAVQRISDSLRGESS
jgi:phenylalanine ammonia-lyase